MVPGNSRGRFDAGFLYRIDFANCGEFKIQEHWRVFLISKKIFEVLGISRHYSFDGGRRCSRVLVALFEGQLYRVVF